MKATSTANPKQPKKQGKFMRARNFICASLLCAGIFFSPKDAAAQRASESSSGPVLSSTYDAREKRSRIGFGYGAFLESKDASNSSSLAVSALLGYEKGARLEEFNLAFGSGSRKGSGELALVYSRQRQIFGGLQYEYYLKLASWLEAGAGALAYLGPDGTSTYVSAYPGAIASFWGLKAGVYPFADIDFSSPHVFGSFGLEASVSYEFSKFEAGATYYLQLLRPNLGQEINFARLEIKYSL